jgi:hypothetical protein
MRTSACVIAIAMLLGITVAAGIKYAYAPTLIAQGFFHPVAHKGSGSASLFQSPDGKWVLHLTSFRTAPRPDLVVYLISAADAFDNDTVASSSMVSLGKLQGSAGNQVYAVPSGIDLGECRAVTIWSEQYHVNFTTAPLRPPRE